MSLTVHRALASESRSRLLEVLRRRGVPVPVDELAAAVGLHVNTVREHLDHLVAADLVARRTEDRVTRGRPRVLYSARRDAGTGTEEVSEAGAGAAGAFVGTTARDELLRVLLAGFGRTRPAEQLAEAAGVACASAVPPDASVDADAPALSAPPADGDPGAQLAALVAHLAALGFAPEVAGAPDGGSVVSLRRCPLRDLACERADVVCGAHLGLARGTLARVPGPLRVDRLERGVTDGRARCALHLRDVTTGPVA